MNALVIRSRTAGLLLAALFLLAGLAATPAGATEAGATGTAESGATEGAEAGATGTAEAEGGAEEGDAEAGGAGEEGEREKIELPSSPRDQVGLILIVAMIVGGLLALWNARKQLQGERKQATGEWRWR